MENPMNITPSMSRRSFVQVAAAAGTAAMAQAGARDDTAEQTLRTGIVDAGNRGVIKLDKAFVSFRIGAPLWIPDARFEELLTLFEKYKGVTDEITFFTSETHPPLPLNTLEERTRLLAKRMTAARALGYRTGINPLATMGHHEENQPNSLNEPYTRATSLDGRTSQGCFCPNSDGLREYAKREYELITAANPDYIWIDDDVRLMGHMPVGETCFCDTCIGMFNATSGSEYTRETLGNALNSGTREAKLAVRRAWLQHNRDTLTRLFKLIEKTVHGMKPGLPLGFMTGDRFFEGYDFDTWAAALSGPGDAEVMWRPGGGNYTEASLDGIADKAHAMGRQTALLPERVVCIQSELESFPYQRLKKSTQTTALEAASYIAGGCTGTAFNVLSMYDEPLDEYEGLVARLAKTRPFLDLLAREFGRSRPAGLYSGWVKDTLASYGAGGHWFHHGDHGQGVGNCNEILCTGIPAGYSAPYARVTALCGESVLALSEEEVLAALSGGVYMDGKALTRLNEMGYGELTGFSVEDTRHEDCIEEFVAHPINGAFAGRRRNGRQSFWKNPTHCLGLTNEKAEVVSRVVDYTYAETAPCCVGVFENHLGGRVCVVGYYPWSQLQNLSKSSQLKSVMRWLSKDTLPGIVASFHRVNLWIREPGKGRLAVALLNAYLDPAENLTLLLATERDEARVIDMTCGEMTVRTSGQDGLYKRFVIPKVGPWDMRCVLV
jgi:hypothetical protein